MSLFMFMTSFLFVREDSLRDFKDIGAAIPCCESSIINIQGYDAAAAVKEMTCF